MIGIFRSLEMLEIDFDHLAVFLRRVESKLVAVEFSFLCSFSFSICSSLSDCWTVCVVGDHC